MKDLPVIRLMLKESKIDFKEQDQGAVSFNGGAYRPAKDGKAIVINYGGRHEVSFLFEEGKLVDVVNGSF